MEISYGGGGRGGLENGARLCVSHMVACKHFACTDSVRVAEAERVNGFEEGPHDLQRSGKANSSFH